MTNEKTINTLNSLKDYYNDKNEDSYVGFDNEDNEALDMAIKALEQTSWIPVTERLPEIGQRILVTYNQEDEVKIDITYYTKHGFLLSVVIAWMPFPELYRSESEDKE